MHAKQAKRPVSPSFRSVSGYNCASAADAHDERTMITASCWTGLEARLFLWFPPTDPLFVRAWMERSDCTWYRPHTERYLYSYLLLLTGSDSELTAGSSTFFRIGAHSGIVDVFNTIKSFDQPTRLPETWPAGIMVGNDKRQTVARLALVLP